MGLFSKDRKETSGSARVAARGTGDRSTGHGQDNMEKLRRPARDIAKLIEGLAPLEQLTPAERLTLAEMAELVRCQAGTVVFDAGDPGRYLYCVIQGGLELRTRTGPGIHQAVRTIGEGQFAGLDAVLNQSDYHLQCVAIQSTGAVRFSALQLHELLHVGRPFAVKFFVALCAELGSQIRDATVSVVRLLEATSLKPRAESGHYDGQLEGILKKK